MGSIRLDLSRHCIETEIKHQYNQSVSQYLKLKSVHSGLEEKIDVLKTALEQLNFSSLRTRYPELAGNNTCEVSLAAGENNEIIIHIEGSIIHM